MKSIPIVIFYSYQRIDTRTGEPGNKRTSRDHRNYCIIDIDENTEKSPGDLRRFRVTQTPVKGYTDVKKCLLLIIIIFLPTWIE